MPSSSTRGHTANLFAKLNVTSRTQAALLAIREGLVGPEN
jgi:DNA-binding NarL/FixJ family response regulator